MNLSLSPIGPWPLLLLLCTGVVVATLWVYLPRIRRGEGRWRYWALGLRLFAVALCLMAAVRPSLVLAEKQTQTAALMFLVDSSTSMTLGDEVQGRSRWEIARECLDLARAGAADLSKTIQPRFYRFDNTLTEFPADDRSPPIGKTTALGSMMLEAVERAQGMPIAGLVVISDGRNNTGKLPEPAAEELRSRQVPVVTVAVGSESTGGSSRDIAVGALQAGPTVFVKNELQVRGTVKVRGFRNQPLEVSLWVEGERVARSTITAAGNDQEVPVTGLKYVPLTPGEKRVTLKVETRDGELVKSNNEASTYINVNKGGLGVLYIRGPGHSWEEKFAVRSLDSSPDIKVDLRVLSKPAGNAVGELDNADLSRNKYDVIILANLPARMLTPNQQRVIADMVQKGAGLMMLGGRDSFGPGGWRDSPIGAILPVDVNPADTERDPEIPLKILPVPTALESYVMQLGSSAADSARIWDLLPPVLGANNFTRPKDAATVWAQTGDRQPMLVAQDVGQGRSLAFGSETWVWARGGEESAKAHRKFWRQVILWLAHKEDSGDNSVQVKLASRQLPPGERLEIFIKANDSKGQPIPNLKYDTKVIRLSPPPKPKPIPPAETKAENKAENKAANPNANPAETRVEVYAQDDQARGVYYTTPDEGEFRVEVVATRPDGAVVGRDQARFLVQLADLELENPAANVALLRQIAKITEGQAIKPEELPKYLESLKDREFVEFIAQSEHRLWDNWPFFLIFTAVLLAEWWIRRQHGWV